MALRCGNMKGIETGIGRMSTVKPLHEKVPVKVEAP
ncbi:hypothetical protein SAMN05216299_12128 [Nitrosospira sp. Nsp14]|nr:hypothetical protein SAMN05216299_12128 [Nitrosospira sp. Nsp14]